MEDIIPKDFDPEPPEPSRFQKLFAKVMLYIATFFLIVIIATYLIPGEGLVSYLQGISLSNTINDQFEIELDDGKVVFTPEVYHQLLSIFETEQEHEFKVCLVGEKIDDTYIINAMEIPHIFSQTVFSVSAAQCSKETLIPLHSHPPQRCVPSSQDLRTQDAFREVNPDSIGGIMCGADRFTFY